MGIFNKTDDRRPSPGTPARGSSPSRGVSGEGAISIIGPGMRIQGDITTEGTVRIEGSVEGSIRAGKSVVLGKDGHVIGNVLTHDAVIGGRVEGTIVAESRLELQSTCVIEGEIRARAEHLQLDEGARFNGQIKMLDDSAPPVRALPAEAQTLAEMIGPRTTQDG